MLLFPIAFTTLRLNAVFKDPNTTMLIVLGAMIAAPMLVRRLKKTLRPGLARPLPPG